MDDCSDASDQVEPEAERGLERAAECLTYSCILELLDASTTEKGETVLLSNLGGEEQRRLMSSIFDSIERSGMNGYLDFMAGSGPEDSAKRSLALAYMARRDIDMFFSSDPPIRHLPCILRSLLLPLHERKEMLMELKAHHVIIGPPSAAPERVDARLVGPAMVHLLPVLERLFSLFLSGAGSPCDQASRAAIGEELSRMAEDWVRALPRPSPLLASLRSLV
jgi:hypothetical protein